MSNIEANLSYLKIQDWAKEDRPREKLIQKGSKVLTNAELLAILIGSGTSKVSAVNLARIILKQYDLATLAKCSVVELQRFKGIGEAKAVNIVSAMELSRRKVHQSQEARQKLVHANSAYRFIKSDLLDKSVEEFWILLVNNANYLIRKQFISSGGLTSTLADPKVVFKAALDYQTAGMILVHNHPSGDPRPSAQDIALTKKLIAGGKLLDITILDHIIIAGDSYFSFSDEQLLFNTSH